MNIVPSVGRGALRLLEGGNMNVEPMTMEHLLHCLERIEGDVFGEEIGGDWHGLCLSGLE